MTIQELKDAAAFLEKLEAAMVENSVKLAGVTIEIGDTFYTVHQKFTLELLDAPALLPEVPDAALEKC